MENVTKEVHYNQYCVSCKYWTFNESNDPCYGCLAQPWNENSHKPINYKPKE